jgi:hypothetical protein
MYMEYFCNDYLFGGQYQHLWTAQGPGYRMENVSRPSRGRGPYKNFSPYI